MSGGIFYPVLALVGAVLLFGAISYAMTARNLIVRRWGCRIAAVFLGLAGLAFAIFPFFDETESSRGGVVWALLMFGVAAWQWRLSTKPFKR